MSGTTMREFTFRKGGFDNRKLDFAQHAQGTAGMCNFGESLICQYSFDVYVATSTWDISRLLIKKGLDMCAY